MFPCIMLLFALTKLLLLIEPEYLTEISNFTYCRPGLGRLAEQELLLIFPQSRGPPHISIF
jgi:hypothetical protein